MTRRFWSLILIALSAAGLFSAGFAFGYWEGFRDGVRSGTAIYFKVDSPAKSD
jgi:hypothetical protein